ncbi:alpha/beta hydrolase [Aliishimia ponticola]|uniref:Alpha/beta hydrolase n=1 Tax=Aliishimia ponticola TaxID=2499833 RepID=A0A4S4ND04_9RHOB|nr:alpha/beta hydrolase [Aliishimia ponticola]THH37346.1 alpha/beta hydrolase [Aliishimia ponticola]
METWYDTPRGPIFAQTYGDPSLPRLLMLHGFPEYSGAWEALAPRLAHRFHCICPDQRGYGKTGGPDDVAAYRTSALVADMAAVIGDEPLTVLGHDWGASVAYGLAMFRPELVDRLIIANGVHPVPFQRALANGGAQAEASQYIKVLRKEGSENRLAEDDYAKLLQLFSAKMDLSWMTPDRLAAYKSAWGGAAGLKTMIHWYRASPLVVAKPGESLPLPDLPLDKLHIAQPHLLIWGTDDTALLPEATEGLEAFAPNLTRVKVDGADHWLAHQAPEKIAEIILDWTTT